MHKIQEMLQKHKITEINGTDSVIFDGHATIQMLPGPQQMGKVCRNMAYQFLDHILTSATITSFKPDCQIHIVFDKYEIIA